MSSGYSYREEILRFLKEKHNTILDTFAFSEDALQNLDETHAKKSSLCIYSGVDSRIKIMLTSQGKHKENVVYCKGDKEVLLFSDLMEFAKYLEMCEKRNFPKNAIFDVAIAQLNTSEMEDFVIQNNLEAEQQKQCGNGPVSKAEYIVDDSKQGFIREEDIITLTDFNFEQMVLPDKILIAKKQMDKSVSVNNEISNIIIEKADMNLETIQMVQRHLYDADYERIEITYSFYMEYKKRRYLSHENSLVFQCEEGKSLMCYFDGKEMNSCTFFANRNDAGSLPADEIPTVMFRGRTESEQHILYDRSILVKILLELLYTGTIEYSPSFHTMKNGYFSIQYFSNKNAYLKSKNQIGEFRYELF